MSQPPLIFIIAGEASGDQLGADLMASLTSFREVRFAGIGGDAMEAQGLQSLFPIQELSLMGVLGILRNLPHLLRRLKQTVKTIQELKPAVVITIDTQEFSTRVMKRLQKMSCRPRLIHYGAPTVWAWRPWRARSLAGILDRLLCLYPFEPPYFEKYGLKTTFVGHPIGKIKVIEEKREENFLCVLPGSRRSEIETLLPIFGQAVERIQKEIPTLKVVIPTLLFLEPMVRTRVQNWSCEVEIVMGDEARKAVFQKASVALAASGTVALQLSAVRLPFVVAYKMSPFNGWIGKLFLRTPWVCMVNILLSFQKLGDGFILTPDAIKLIPTPWIPEFIQKNCTPENLSSAVVTLLKDEKARAQQRDAMAKAITLLQAPSNAAAKAILEEVEEIV
ncbi:MAG: lipid-A-disaccharide synthase [Alphaproteobacteria bacterium]|nr:lipid-A-disaccharide synthase [Alphaproteobacteria bacterium]